MGDAWPQPPANGLLGSMGRRRNFNVSSTANISLPDFLENTFSANVSGINLPGALTSEEQDILTEYTSNAGTTYFDE